MAPVNNNNIISVYNGRHVTDGQTDRQTTQSSAQWTGSSHSRFI